MDTDDVTDSMDNWKILKSSSIDDDLSPVLLVLWIESWVNHLDRADESVAVDLVWECGVSDHTIEVHWVSRGEGSFVQFNILVLLSRKYSC